MYLDVVASLLFRVGWVNAYDVMDHNRVRRVQQLLQLMWDISKPKPPLSQNLLKIWIAVDPLTFVHVLFRNETNSETDT